MICPYCREIILDGAVKCRYCGSMLNPDRHNSIHADIISSDDIRAFVGARSYYYTQQFSKFTILGREQFSVTWNWSCCGFASFWFLYRKMYFWAALSFVLFLLPGVNVLLHIAVGMVGNFLYYKHAKARIIEIRATTSPQNYTPALQELGGVNTWVITIGVAAAVLLIITVALFFSVIISSMGRYAGITI